MPACSMSDLSLMPSVAVAWRRNGILSAALYGSGPDAEWILASAACENLEWDQIPATGTFQESDEENASMLPVVIHILQPPAIIWCMLGADLSQDNVLMFQ